MNKEPQKRYIEMALSQAQVPARNLAAATEAASGLLSRAYFNDDCHMMEVLATAYVKKDIAAKAGLKSASSVNSGIAALVAAGVLMSLFILPDTRTDSRCKALHTRRNGEETLGEDICPVWNGVTSGSDGQMSAEAGRTKDTRPAAVRAVRAQTSGSRLEPA